MSLQIQPQSPILITGSGPSGLLLSHALLKSGTPFRLYERDPQFNKRTQGYRFKITNHGTAALHSILSPEHFQLVQDSCGEYLPPNFNPIDALTAETLPELKLPRHLAQEPLAADRRVFRDVLMRGLDGFVETGKEVVGFEVLDDGEEGKEKDEEGGKSKGEGENKGEGKGEGRVRVTFADGTIAEGSMLIGADGSRSRIRQQLIPAQKLLDTEGCAIYGKTPLTPALLAKFNPAAMTGLTLIQERYPHTGNAVATTLLEPMRFPLREKVRSQTAGEIELPDDYVYWVIGFHKDRLLDDSELSSRYSLANHHHLSTEDCALLSQELTKHWHSSLRVLYEMQDVGQASFLRLGITGMDLVPWKGSRVALVGDSVHALPPTGGIGATTALRDVEVLMEEGGVVGEGDGEEGWEGKRGAGEGTGGGNKGMKWSEEGLGKYQERMREYAREAIWISHEGAKNFFGIRGMEELEVLE